MRNLYYVSSVHGRDENDGCSEERPFLSLNAVNRLKLGPGDKGLLERGSVFCGQALCIRGRGSSDLPIEVGAYGEGNNPVIHAEGTGVWYQDYGTLLDAPTHRYAGYVSSAVLLYDADHICIHDLEITNCGDEVPGVRCDADNGCRHESKNKSQGEAYCAPDKMDRTGVAVVAQNGGTLQDIVLRDLYIHDVHGNIYNKHMANGGIYFVALKPENEGATGVARYENVLVEDCCVFRVSRWGIAVGYTYAHEQFQGIELSEDTFRKYGNEHVILRNNYVKDAGGDGITAMYALRPLVEHNTVDSVAQEMNDRIYRYPGKRMGKVAAAIWPWKCKDALFRWNEAVDTRLNQDGMAYDADSGDGTVYEYNYSRLNEGGCVMFCMEEAVHNTFCHNVSFHDLGGTISPATNPDAYIAHNRFFVRKGTPFVRKNMDGGAYTLEENEWVEV